MDLAIHLRRSNPANELGLNALSKRPCLGELPVVAEEVVDPEAEVDRVVLLQRVLDDEVILVALPAVGQAVGVDAEVRAVPAACRWCCRCSCSGSSRRP